MTQGFNVPVQENTESKRRGNRKNKKELVPHSLKKETETTDSRRFFSGARTPRALQSRDRVAHVFTVRVRDDRERARSVRERERYSQLFFCSLLFN